MQTKTNNPLRNLQKKITDEKTLWRPDKAKREGTAQIEKWNSLIGIFSLSAVPDNILMWSHYSYNHTGFLVGLDSNSLVTDYDFDFIEPIEYSQDYPIIIHKDNTTQQFYKKFFSKSGLWDYEQEWRITKNHIKNRIVKLNKPSIKSIIMGCRISKKSKSELINITKRNFMKEIELYQAYQNEDRFELNIDRIR